MTTKTNQENQKTNGQHDLGQITEDQPKHDLDTNIFTNCEMHQTGNYAPKDKRREEIEELIESLDGANMTKTIRALNGLERGNYRISILRDSEFNEVQVRLKDGAGGKHQIACGYIDQGHTTETRFEAAAEVRGLVRAYLCR